MRMGEKNPPKEEESPANEFKSCNCCVIFGVASKDNAVGL